MPLSSYHSTASTSASLCDGAAAARRPRHACDYSLNGPRNETLGAATPTCACRKVYMRIASCSRSITTSIASQQYIRLPRGEPVTSGWRKGRRIPGRTEFSASIHHHSRPFAQLGISWDVASAVHHAHAYGTCSRCPVTRQISMPSWPSPASVARPRRCCVLLNSIDLN